MATRPEAPPAFQYTPPATEPPGRYLSSRRHRQLIGMLGLALPTLLVAIAWVFPNDAATRWPIRDSISAYYYTSGVAVFVGVLVALAVFLLVYQGYPNRRYHWADRGAAVIAGIAALGVAFFPTETRAPVPALLWWRPFTGQLHYVSAAVLFSMFAVFSLWLFRLTTPGSEKSPDKKRRDAFYALCGIVIVACMVWARLAHVAHRSIFWPETIALVSFALSWLVKGASHRDDRGEATQRGVRESF